MIVDFKNRRSKYEPGVFGDRLSETPLPPSLDEESPQQEVPAQEVPRQEIHDSVDNEPQKSDYQWNQDFINSFLEKPITAEEEKRRKKAASASQAVGHLGNVLNAFSNLVFTGKNAPSQKLPIVPDGELKTFEDRIAGKRMQYAGMLANARDRDDSAYARALSLYHNNKNAIARQKAKELENKQKEDRFTRELEYKTKRAEIADKQKELELAERTRSNKVNEAIGWAKVNKIGEGKKANGNKKSSSSKKDYGKYHFTSQQGLQSREFDLNKEQDVIQMYREGVRSGLYPEIVAKGSLADINVNKLRNHILYHLGGNQKPTKSINEMESIKEGKTSAPWTNNNNQTKAPWLK